MDLKFLSPVRIDKLLPSVLSDSALEAGFFTAYANTWTRDRVSDVVMPGAFTESIKAMQSGRLSVPLLWKHDHSQVLGAILSAKEDDRGLLVDGQIVTGTEIADRAYRLAVKGALSLSIGFMPVDLQPINGGGSLIKSLDLHEVSLVPVPANSQSTILAVKALQQLGRADWERMFTSGTLPPMNNRTSALLTKAAMSVLATVGGDDAPIKKPEEPDTTESEVAAVLTASLARLKKL